MKKLTEHLRDEMLIAQIIYEFNVNLSHHSCSKYFVKDEVWLNACNLSITRFIVKLDDRNVDFFKIKCIFKNNSLIIKLNLSAFMKIHSIFHVILLSHIASDSLSSQRQKSWELLRVCQDWIEFSSQQALEVLTHVESLASTLYSSAFNTWANLLRSLCFALL